MGERETLGKGRFVKGSEEVLVRCGRAFNGRFDPHPPLHNVPIARPLTSKDHDVKGGRPETVVPGPSNVEEEERNVKRPVAVGGMGPLT